MSSSGKRRVRSCPWKLLVRRGWEAQVPFSQQSVPTRAGSLHLPCGTTNASKTVWQMQSSMEFVMPGLSDGLLRAPHTNGKLLTATALYSYLLYHSCLVYIPHVLTTEAEQIDHVNLSHFPPVIQFAYRCFLPTLEGCYSMLTYWSSSVSIYIFFFPSYTLSNLQGEHPACPQSPVKWRVLLL